METIKTECGYCCGTGLYQGMAEREGVAVVCIPCNGSGCHKISYMPFRARKPRKEVSIVYFSRGSFLMHCGPGGNSVTYEEFQQGKLPTKVQ